MNYRHLVLMARIFARYCNNNGMLPSQAKLAAEISQLKMLMRKGDKNDERIIV